MMRRIALPSIVGARLILSTQNRTRSGDCVRNELREWEGTKFGQLC